MPHIVLEYSDKLPELADFRALFADIHRALNRIGGIVNQTASGFVARTAA